MLMKIERSLIALTACAFLVTAMGMRAQAAETRRQKTLVFILAENEYRAWRTIPEFGLLMASVPQLLDPIPSSCLF